jgi:hypothetical protein
LHSTACYRGSGTLSSSICSLVTNFLVGHKATLENPTLWATSSSIDKHSSLFHDAGLKRFYRRRTQDSATPSQQPNGFFDSYFVSYTAAKIAGWGSPAGPYHPGPPHMSHHPGSGMKEGPPGYPPHPQLMDMYSGVSPATAINTMDWKNTSQVGLKTSSLKT